MPCPFFEPKRVVTICTHANARLPLIEEYEGQCHAGAEGVSAPQDVRFRCCNQGNSRGLCSRFPQGEPISALRYQVVESTAAEITVLCIEEADYAPARWYSLLYSVEHGALQPNLASFCIQAQAVAFCRSHLAHFGDIHRTN